MSEIQLLDSSHAQVGLYGIETKTGSWLLEVEPQVSRLSREVGGSRQSFTVSSFRVESKGDGLFLLPSDDRSRANSFTLTQVETIELHRERIAA